MALCLTVLLLPMQAAFAAEKDAQTTDIEELGAASAEDASATDIGEAAFSDAESLAPLADDSIDDQGLQAQLAAFSEYVASSQEVSAQSLDLSIEPQAAPNWKRLQGAGRYETMQAIAKVSHSATSDVVILATGSSFPDALAASSLCGLYSAPLLLTEPGKLSTQTNAEITRLKAKRVVIVGGTGSVSANIETTLKAKLGNQNVTRLAGSGRYETAVKIYEHGKAQAAWGSAAIIVTANSFPDALSIAPVAHTARFPIFLYDTVNKRFTPETLSAIKAGGFNKFLLVGGTGSLPDTIKSAIGTNKTYERIAGADRYKTSAAIAAYAVTNNLLDFDNIAIATGRNFPDALSGAALCGTYKSVLLLADNTVEGRFALYHIAGLGCLYNMINTGYLLGGTGTIGTALENTTQNLGTHASYENQVLTLVNQERAKAGVAPLAANPFLVVATDIRADEISRLFSHTRRDGSRWSTVLDYFTYRCSAAGENIAAGYQTPAQVVAAWMGSQGHRDNILNPTFTKLGVGYVKDGSVDYWVQLFSS
ncbi:MAG: cell wall-binding repeat-containing protein [Coriobacteriales bacterium]|nr:cell wall-binding repeat-containing protein [Coriobacteriales bacterium]